MFSIILSATVSRGAIAHVSKNPRVNEAHCEHESFSSLSGLCFFVSPSLIKKMVSSRLDPQIRDLRAYGNIWHHGHQCRHQCWGAFLAKRHILCSQTEQDSKRVHVVANAQLRI